MSKKQVHYIRGVILIKKNNCIARFRNYNMETFISN